MSRILSPFEVEERQKAQEEHQAALRQGQAKKGWALWQKIVVWLLIMAIIRLVIMVFFGR